MVAGTLSKCIGLASGGYIAGPHTAIELFRQLARGYVFTVSTEPAICEAALKVSFLFSRVTIMVFNPLPL